MAQPQNQVPYGQMSVTKDLRPMLKRAGFKNYNRFNRELLAEICEEYDRVNQVRIRDLPINRSPSEADEEACNAIIKSWLERRESESTPTTAVQTSRTNTKRKQTETAESPKGKRQKVSHGGKNDKDRDGDAGARHVSGKDNVSETNAQAIETQTTHKTHETRKRPLKSKQATSRSGDPAPASGTNTTTKTSKAAKTPVAPNQPVAPKAAQQSVPANASKQSVASKTKQSQAPTRRSARNKKSMDITRPSGEESRDPQTEVSEPTVSRAEDTSTPPANRSSATERLGVKDDGARPEDGSGDPDDSSDDSEDDGEEVEDDGEDDSDDSDEEQRPRPTPKSPARRTSHNYDLGTHRTFRFEPKWDPLDERIPTSSLNWFEQVQRQRAIKAQLHRETGAASPSEGGPKPTKE